jgi:hypothetical protein
MGAAEKRLQQGVGESPLAVSRESQRLASKIVDDAPLADYWRLLLSGKAREAAQLAWRNARAARSDVDYRAWVAATALALRSHEKCIEGRPQQFLRWTEGTLVDAKGLPVNENPAAQVLGE